jgi:hypothetical protein
LNLIELTEFKLQSIPVYQLVWEFLYQAVHIALQYHLLHPTEQPRQHLSTKEEHLVEPHVSILLADEASPMNWIHKNT